MGQIRCPKPETGGVDAGVAADIFAVQYICVDQKLNPVVLVVHKAKDAEGSRSDVQKGFHIFRTGKRESGRADLLGKLAGFKMLVSRDQE